MYIVRLASRKELASRSGVYIDDNLMTSYRDNTKDTFGMPHTMYNALYGKDLKLTKEQLHSLQTKNGSTINGWVVQPWMLRIEDLIKYKLL